MAGALEFFTSLGQRPTSAQPPGGSARLSEFIGERVASSSLPTEVQGVPVRGQERLNEVFEQLEPIFSGRAKTVPDIFKTIPKLPANTPDISLGDPNPPGFSALSLEDFLEAVRRRHGVGI